MYAVVDCYESFPLPEGISDSSEMKSTGTAYYDERAALMNRGNEGLTKLYNRFHSAADQSAEIVSLRRLHDKMDRSMLRAYGWHDLADKARPENLTEENEDEPKYQGRLFWPADFRSEVLARLLDLNAKRAAEDAAAGATSAKPKGLRTRKKGFSEPAAPTLL